VAHSKRKETHKKITYFVCLSIVVGVLVWTALIGGVLGHELLHKNAGDEIRLIQVNFDGSGATYGRTYGHSHQAVYFNGYLLEGSILMVLFLSLMVVINR